MHDLRLVGVHDDGEHLVLTGADGEKFRLRVDEPLRAAVRRDRPGLGQLQMQLDGGLRPREIQSRIRGGESAEDIAAASGLPIEHIRRYEGPVLAEREFIARQARNVRMRGISRIDGTVPTLGELVSERLAAREVNINDDSWDAWRGDDGVWVVSLSFSAGGRERQALWAYDAALRHVHPQDDEARWLSEQQREGEAPGAAVHRRLTSVREVREGRAEHVFDVEAESLVVHIESEFTVDAELASEQEEDHDSTVNLLESLRERRGRRQRLPSFDDLEEDELFERAPAQPRARLEDRDIPSAHPPRSRPDLAHDAEILELPSEHPGPAIADARASADAPNEMPETSHDVPVTERPKVTPTQVLRAKRSGKSFPTGSGSPHGASRRDPAKPARGSRSATTEQLAPAARKHGTGSPSAPAEPESTTPPATTKRAKRTSVPTWDDIVFGGRRE